MNSKTESAPSALTFCRIEAGERQEELLQSIREILTEGNSHTAQIFDALYWNWQYKNLPSRKAGIYICLDNGKIAGYYHVPFYEGMLDGVKKLFGMVQDVAMTNRLRGKGAFRQLAEFATNDLLTAGVNLLYTFPNDKSIRTFLKYNDYSAVHIFDSYILPVKCSSIIQTKIRLAGLEKLIGAVADLFFKRIFNLTSTERINVRTTFDEGVFSLLEKFALRFPVHRHRSKEYLNWRYVEKPSSNHVIITLTEGARTIAAGVFKTDIIFNANALLLLDFAFEQEEHLAKLIHQVKNRAEEIFHQPAALIFTAFCSDSFLKRRHYGFIRIPKKFNPRNLNMLVRNISADGNLILKKENWFATLGDWDVF